MVSAAPQAQFARLAGRAQCSSGCPGAVSETDRAFTWSKAHGGLVEGQGDSSEASSPF